jgi:hypothetical protein
MKGQKAPTDREATTIDQGPAKPNEIRYRHFLGKSTTNNARIE